MDRHITTTLLITAAILIVGHLAGLMITPQLFDAGIIGQLGIEIAWNLVAVMPPAIAGIIIVMRGHRSGYWFWILVPGILIWVMRPFGTFTNGWKLYWIDDFLSAYSREIWPVLWHGKSMSVGATTFFLGGFLMVLLAAMISGASIRQFKKDIRRAGRTMGKGYGGAGGGAARDGLPQSNWASRREVRKHFSHPGGIVLGELTDPIRDTPKFSPSKPRTWKRQGRGPLITMNPAEGNGHVLVTSQASAYKSTGIVIPNILHYDGPINVVDPKCELYERTRKARKDMGFDAVVIDAHNGYDPARFISLLAKDHPSAYLRMAKMMIPRGYASGVENGQFFKDAATALFTGLLGFYAENGSDNIIGDIAQILSLPAKEVHRAVKDKLEETKHDFIINRLKDLEGMESRFFHSIKTEITNNLLFAEFPDIQKYATMDENSPMLAKLVDPKTDIFLNIPQHVAEDFAPMMRLMLGSFLVAAQLIEVNEAPRARRLLIIDEAAKLGNMDVLENIRDRGRSIGLHLMMFYQTPGEIAKIWGREGMSSWRDGCSATVMGPVSARESAQDLSTMLGSRTVRVTTEGSSSQHQVMSPMGGSVSSSESEQLRDVPLISPTMISQLPRHASIITAPGFRPILGTKAPWFTRSDMRGKVRSTEAIAENLDVTASQKSLLKRLNRSQGAKASEDKTSSQADKQTSRREKTGGVDTQGDEAPRTASSHETASEAASPSEPPGDAGAKPAESVEPRADQETQTAETSADEGSKPASRPEADGPSDDETKPHEDADDDGFDIAHEKLVYAWQPKRVPPLLQPLWTLWCIYMIPRHDTPLNIRHDTGEIIPHPKDVSDGLLIIRLWDLMAWYTGHPDGRYELYDLKRRRRQWDGLEWRLHLLKCWIRNEPRGLPPGLQPKGDPPDHVTFRERISPATKDLKTTDARYDPVANAVKVPHTTKAPPPSVEWEPDDVGRLPLGQPPQLVFEHVLSADDPSGHPDNVSFLEFMRVKIEQDVLVEALLRHRQPLNEADMLFFDQWPEIPSQRAAQSGMSVSDWSAPLKDWNAVLWIDRIDNEWRLFRQAVYGPTGMPLGAARTWPIVDHNLEWLDKPIVRRPLWQDAWE